LSVTQINAEPVFMKMLTTLQIKSAA